MEILITGASGFIGNAALEYFSREHKVTGADLFANPSKNILQCDQFSKTKALISKNKFDVIINCAGSSNVSQSFKTPDLDFKLNTVLVQHLLQTICDCSPATKLIQLSSAAVYGNPQTLPIGEDCIKNPLSPYGVNKLLSEQLVSSYATFNGLQALSVRIFSAYGPGLKRQFFYDLYKKFTSGEENILLSGTGNESRDFVYIADIVAALETLIEKANFTGEVYNLASEQECFIAPMAKLFAQICGYKGDISFSQKQFAGYPLNWQASTSKLKHLGFEARINPEEGLTTYFQWLKNNDLA